MINRKQLGLRIREARLRRGMSQQELALAVGVSDKTISAYEVGRVDPPLEALEKLSLATAHPIGYFVGDVQSNIEARLDRIAEELVAIRKTLHNVHSGTVVADTLNTDSAVMPNSSQESSEL